MNAMARATAWRTPWTPTLACLVAVLSAPVPAVDRELAARYYENAEQRFENGDFKGAAIQLKNALQEDSLNLPARILLSRVYLRNGDGAAAEKELLTARAGGADPMLVEVPLAEAYYLQRKYRSIFDEFPRGGRGREIEGALLIIRGNAYLQLNDPDTAFHEFDDAVLLRPDDPVPMLGLARVAMLGGDFERARDLAARARSLDEELPDAWHVEAEILRASGDMAGAVERYSRVIGMAPQHVPARIGRAVALLELDRDAQALDDLEFARDIDPQDPQAAYFHALILARSAEIDAALEVLRAAGTTLLEGDPAFLRSHPPSTLLAGLIHYSQGHLTDALNAMWAYVKLNPNHAGARKLLGAILLKNGDPGLAVSILRPALDLAPRDPAVHALLGVAYTRKGDTADGLRALGRAVDLAPNDIDYRTELAQARLEDGAVDAALAELDRALALDAQAARPAVLLGLTQLRHGRYREALEAATRMISAQPENAFAWSLKGAAEAGLGDTEAAGASFRQAVNVDPDYLSAYFNLAELDLRTGRAEAARTHYRDVLERDPRNARAMMELAALAQAEGSLDTAVEWLQKARAAEPEALTAQLALVSIYLRTGDIEAARAIAGALLEQHPNRLSVLEAAGQTALAARDIAGARETFRRMALLGRHSVADLVRIAALQAQIPDVGGAREALDRALFIDAESVAALAARADLEIRHGRLPDARAFVERLGARAPGDGVTALARGDLLVREGKPAEALVQFQDALQKAAATATVLRVHLAQRATGQTAASIETLRAWAATHPRDFEARRALAGAYLADGRLEQAVTEHEALLATAPEDPLLLNNLAWLYQELGAEQALEYAERAYTLAPEQAAIADTFGWVLVRRGETSRGLALLRDAHSRDAGNARIRYHLAAALAALGRKEEARKHLDATLRGDPEPEIAASAKELLRSLEEGGGAQP
jgi:putative PEP-CTERM system TPR-repeat lipoprotein